MNPCKTPKEKETCGPRTNCLGGECVEEFELDKHARLALGEAPCPRLLLKVLINV